ncbi:MAG: ABC transporter permease [Candidatus Omnitrophica bacterium]|nr:ABC transporter permease [Candidatus Omnitrophota bacterium]
MLKFIVQRVLVSVPMLLGITFLTFFLMRLTPGSYLDTMRLDPQVSQETIERYQKLYQLDKPLIEQYFSWVKNIFRGELGHSFHYNVPVAHLISGRMLNTFVLSLAAFLVTWLIAIPLGIWAAVHRDRWQDKWVQFFSYVFLSFPSFFLAMIFLFWASRTGGLPLGGMRSLTFEELSLPSQVLDLFKHLAIPTVALSLGSIGALQKIMRGNMLEVLGQQYILAARAKGLPENRVLYVHALRNAINPLITLLGYEFSSLLSGAALIEIICSWPGLGSLMLKAVMAKDIYLVMASMLMGSVMFIGGNLLADLALAKADPRIRYDK